MHNPSPTTHLPACALASLFTGKERDTESGLDYFGARYYASGMWRMMSPDWSAKASPVPYADLANPQSLNLYSYVTNNPLNRTDPTGHDWFNVNNQWQWQKGHTYHDADGNATKDKGYAGLLVATKTGTNKQGATTYNLTLYGDSTKPVMTGTGFSGGNAPLGNGSSIYMKPINDGNYTIHLDIRNAAASSIDPRSGQPPETFGIQPIPQGNIEGYKVYDAYGPIRARLNPWSGPDHGDYFHGQFDGYGYTHGCLCYGTDTRMADYMMNHMPHAPIGVSVDTPVQP